MAETRGRFKGARSLDDLLLLGQCFVVMVDGVPVGAYLLQLQGSEVFILAAAGGGPVDMTAAIDLAVCRQAEQFETVAFHTVRRGLKKKARALGYRQEGNIMRKRVRHEHF